MNQLPPRPPGQLPPMEIPPDMPVEYVNLVRIAHSISELVFDFAHILPGPNQPRVSSRIVMSPLSAKLFHRALSENLAKYEAAFGEIKGPGDTTLAEHLFRQQNPPNPE